MWCSGRGWRWSVALSPPQRRWEMLLKMEYSLDFILPSVDASRLAKDFLFFFWLVCLSCLPPPLWCCLTSIPLYTTLTAAYCKERIANASLIKGRDVKNGFLNSLPTCRKHSRLSAKLGFVEISLRMIAGTKSDCGRRMYAHADAQSILTG